MWRNYIWLIILFITLHSGNLFADTLAPQDTTILAGKYKILFKEIIDEGKVQKLNEIRGSTNWGKIEIITNFDSVLAILGDEVKIDYKLYPTSETPYITSITCRNGVKLMLDESYIFQGYYPATDVISFLGCYYLGIGEKVSDPKLCYYDRSTNDRINAEGYPHDRKVILEKYESSSGTFTPLVNLIGLFGQDTYITPLQMEGKLFVAVDFKWKEIIIQKGKKDVGFIEIEYEEREEGVKWLDTLFTYKNHTYHLQRIPITTFNPLKEKYRDSQKPSKVIRDLREAQKYLRKDYKIVESLYGGISEISYKNKIRYFMSEQEGFNCYYPKEKIFLYYGGHSSDKGVYLPTFEGAYNPHYSAVPKKGLYRLTGLHTGQESVTYTIEKWDKNQKSYIPISISEEMLSAFYEHGLGHSSFLFNPFWIGDTLYFHTGGEGWGSKRCFMLTIRE